MVLAAGVAGEAGAVIGRSSSSSIRSSAACPDWPAWYSIARRRKGTKNSGMSTSTANPVPKGRSLSIMRKLISTAASAVAAVAAHSITNEVWNAVRSTSIVVSPKRRLTPSIVSAPSSERPNALSVPSPRIMSR